MVCLTGDGARPLLGVGAVAVDSAVDACAAVVPELEDFGLGHHGRVARCGHRQRAVRGPALNGGLQGLLLRSDANRNGAQIAGDGARRIVTFAPPGCGRPQCSTAPLLSHASKAGKAGRRPRPLWTRERGLPPDLIHDAVAEAWGSMSSRDARHERELLTGCPAVVGCSRLSVGNTRGSCWGDRHSRWSQACRRWTVNPWRKLRRFESFTCHHVLSWSGCDRVKPGRLRPFVSNT